MEQTSTPKPPKYAWSFMYTPGCCGLRFLSRDESHINPAVLADLKQRGIGKYLLWVPFPTVHAIVQMRKNQKSQVSHVIWTVDKSLIEETKVLVEELDRAGETVTLMESPSGEYMMVWS